MNFSFQTFSKKLYRSILFPVVFALILFSATTAQAHKVNIFAYVDGDRIYSESYFPDGRPCVETDVHIENSEGEKLLEGKTDSDGIFIFKIPARTDLVIVLDAGMGHRAEYKIPASELPDIKIKEATKPVTEKTHEKKPAPTTEPEKERDPEPVAAPTSNTGACPEAEIQKLVDAAVSKKLKPIIKSIEKEQQPGISEILGGTGYIIGLAGIWLYFTRRKKTKD